MLILRGDVANFGDGWQKTSIDAGGLQEYEENLSMYWLDEYDWAYMNGENKLGGDRNNAIVCFYNEDTGIMAL